MLAEQEPNRLVREAHRVGPPSERLRKRLERAAAAHLATAEDVADRQVEPAPRERVDPFLVAGDDDLPVREALL